MKKIIFTIVTLFICSVSFAQINENFTDGDFTTNPTWAGDDSVFTVIGGKLRSNKLIANSTYALSTANTTATNCQWEFSVNLQFNTSSTNLVDAYLTSDQSNLKATNINGYYVEIGGTADKISLYKKVNGTATEIITGATGITNTSNNTLKIKVVRTSANLFTLYRDITGTGNNYIAEGSVTDNAVTTSSYFGFYIKQSTSNFYQKHFFDDITVGAIIVDNTPPTITSATASNTTTVAVLFSENVDATTAQTVTNYTVSGGIGNPTSAVRDNTNKALVTLTLSTPVTANTTYNLTVNNVADESSNVIAANSQANFSYSQAVIVAAVSKDLVINEIYADNSSSQNVTAINGKAEFVELYNRSNKTLNLTGWRLTANTSSYTIQGKVIQPGGYIILVANADTAFYQTYGATASLTPAPSLTNAGAKLTLKDNTGKIIDWITYSDQWYQSASKKDGAYTLERINPNDSCLQSGNWIASTNSAIGGTPGMQNSVYAITVDNQGPTLIKAKVQTTTTILLYFNEALDSAIAANPIKYIVTGTPMNVLSAQPIGPDFTTVKLTVSSAIDSGTIYTCNANNIADCKGNVTANTNMQFAIYKNMSMFDIVINEIMYDPEPSYGLPAYEYIELYNTRPYPLSTNKMKLKIGSSNYTLPDVEIAPNGYLLVTTTAAIPQFGITNVAGLSTMSISNDAGTITLSDSASNVLHSVTYTLDWFNGTYKKDGGWSLEQINYNNPCQGEGNWAASTNGNGGTPGVVNSIYSAANTDVTMPDAVRAVLIDSVTVKLYFSEQIALSTLKDTLNYTIDNGIGYPDSAIAIGPDFYTVRLHLRKPINKGAIYTLTIQSSKVEDCLGNKLSATYSTVKIARSEIATAGDVIVNEILSNAKDDGVDWVEIYNKSSKVLDLKDLKIASWDTKKKILIDVHTIVAGGYLVFPSDYVVLSTKPQAIKKQYLTTNKYGFATLEKIPSLSIDSGSVILLDKQDAVLERVDYTEKMQYSLLTSTKGVSLERIDFNRPSNDITNWASAAEAVGYATPAYKNSQYSAGNATADVSLDPEIFSPDNDGYNDNLTISYKLDKAGYVANVTVYDINGVPIKKLKQNELLGIEGSFSWDGMNENREKQRIGNYVIMFSAFTQDGTIKNKKLVATLAGKL